MANQPTVLLAEDDEMFVLLAKTMLEELGFEVLDTKNGAEALTVYHHNNEKIKLVVTDIGMPIMDGYELVRQLNQCAPNLPIYVSSGLPDCEITEQLPPESIAGIIKKPYTFESLKGILLPTK